MISFSKMNGAGNDFVVIDNMDLSISLKPSEIERICNRQRGVGSDGLLMVNPSSMLGIKYKMRYYNSDGGEAEMCGNGARCFAKFLSNLEDIKSTYEDISFETMAGVIKAKFIDDQVKIQLSNPYDINLDNRLIIDGKSYKVSSINTGVPHAVIFMDDLDKVDVRSLGSKIRYNNFFADKGTNVNFVETNINNKRNHIKIRTYERGVEDETLACGTGMVACAIVHHKINNIDPTIYVDVKGGDTLNVDFSYNNDSQIDNVNLLGPAKFTFQGNILID